MSLPVETVLALLQAHPYLLLFPLVLLEGPIATVGAGLLVATGVMEWRAAYAIAVAADLAGDSLYYALGRGARRPGVGGLLSRLGLTPERLATMEASFSGKAGRAILGAKVVDAAAVPVFVAAGLAKVGYGRFFGWTAAATVPKAALLMVLGYFAGGQAPDALLQRLDGGPAALLALLVAAPVTVAAVVASKKLPGRVPEREPAYAEQTVNNKEEDR
jgi:membrane protein DedA with SNARE-associated domain